MVDGTKKKLLILASNILKGFFDLSENFWDELINKILLKPRKLTSCDLSVPRKHSEDSRKMQQQNDKIVSKKKSPLIRLNSSPKILPSSEESRQLGHSISFKKESYKIISKLLKPFVFCTQNANF